MSTEKTFKYEHLLTFAGALGSLLFVTMFYIQYRKNTKFQELQQKLIMEQLKELRKKNGNSNVEKSKPY